MTATTLNERTQTGKRRLARVRVALAEGARQGATMVSAARHRLRRPALTIAGLGCIDAAFYQFGWFPGLLVTGISIIAFEAMGGEDE